MLQLLIDAIEWLIPALITLAFIRRFVCPKVPPEKFVRQLGRPQEYRRLSLNDRLIGHLVYYDRDKKYVVGLTSEFDIVRLPEER